MEQCELPLKHQLITYLGHKPGIRLIGPQASDHSRVATVSFVHDELSSSDIVAAVDTSGIAIRHGHMYAYHLCEALGLEPDDGVVRISAVHYNTPEEIEHLIRVFDSAIEAPRAPA